MNDGSSDRSQFAAPCPKERAFDLREDFSFRIANERVSIPSDLRLGFSNFSGLSTAGGICFCRVENHASLAAFENSTPRVSTIRSHAIL